MAVTLRSGWTSTLFLQPGSGTVAAPTTIVDGDELVLAVFIGCNDPGPPVTPTPPTGFSAPTVTSGSAFPIAVDSGFAGDLYVWTKKAASESGSYVFTYTTAQAGIGVEVWMGAIASPDGTTPIEFCTTNSGTNTTTGGVGGSSTATGGTTAATGDGVLLIGFDYNDSTNALTLPGTTPTFTVALTPPASNNFTVGFGAMAAAGATGNKVFVNNSSSGDPWGVAMIGFNASTSTDASVAVPTAMARASASPPGITLVQDASVAVPTAMARAFSVGPLAQGTVSASLTAVTAFARAWAAVPTVSTASEVDVSVTAISAAARSFASVPDILVTEDLFAVGAVTAYASAFASPPLVVVSGNVAVPTAFARVAGGVPSVSATTGEIDVSVTAVAAYASAFASPPTVVATSSASPTVNAPTASAFAWAPAPTLTGTGINASVAVPTAMARAFSHVPKVVVHQPGEYDGIMEFFDSFGRDTVTFALGIVDTAKATTPEIHNGFLRDVDNLYALVTTTDPTGGTMLNNFLRSPADELVIVDEADATGTLFIGGFLRDASSALVTTTDATDFVGGFVRDDTGAVLVVEVI